MKRGLYFAWATGAWVGLYALGIYHYSRKKDRETAFCKNCLVSKTRRATMKAVRSNNAQI